MQSQTWLIILIWVLWAGSAVQCVLAVNALRVESREGMPVARLRTILVVSGFTVASVLTLAITFLPRQPVDPLAAPVMPELAGDHDLQPATVLRRKLADARIEWQKSEEKSRKLEAQLQEVQPKDGHFRQTSVNNVLRGVESIDWQTRAVFTLVILTFLFLLGFIFLIVLGQLQTLLPESWPLGSGRAASDAALQRDLDELASLVWEEKYREALEHAKKIPDRKLRAFDQLDFLFLRAYSAVQVAAFPGANDTVEQRRNLLESSVRDLEIVVSQAPKRSEALYTLGMAYGLSEAHAQALDSFERSRQILPTEKDLPLRHNESVCLLRLAERSLSDGNTAAAEAYFSRVAGLAALTDAVAQSRLRIGMLDLRNAIHGQDLATASTALEKIVGLRDLGEQQKAQVDVICSALRARIALRRDDVQLAFEEASGFLATHLPSDLPPLDDGIANEFFSPVLDADLAFPRDVYQGFLLIQAVALSRRQALGRTRPTEENIAKLADPLLRALQFVPRHRDILGALGGLYYWFRREKHTDAREWLEAAASMGVRGRMVRAILDFDRLVETERRQALDWFRSASSRFLRDPTLANDMRRALVEELGRFQEFEPLLISLQERPEIEREEPTIQALRERAAYLVALLENFLGSSQSQKYSRLSQIHGEYSASLAHLEQTVEVISGLERRVFCELSETLLLE